MKRLMCIILCLAVLIMMAGCGSSGSSAETSQPESGTVSEPESSTVTEPEIETKPENDVPDSPVYDAADGPVFIKRESQSSNDKWSLYLYSLKTGELYKIFSYDQQKNIAELGHSTQFAIDLWRAGNYFHEQLFDTKLERLAVSWIEKSDNSTHVGWLNADGSTVDVTEIVHPASSGFSSVTPQDKYALFTSDDRLIFYDDNQKVWCYFDEATESIVETFDWSMETDEYRYTGNGFIGLNSSDRPTTDHMEVGGVTYLITYQTDILPTSSRIVRDYVIRPDGASLFMVELHAIKHFGKGIKGDGKTWEDAVTITPPTEYTVENMAYSGGKIIFTANRGTERALFMMSYEDGVAGEPELVTEIDDKWGDLFFWEG